MFLILAFNNLENQITQPITDDERERERRRVFEGFLFQGSAFSLTRFRIRQHCTPNTSGKREQNPKENKITEISKSRKSLDDLVGLQPQGKCYSPALRHHEATQADSACARPEETIARPPPSVRPQCRAAHATPTPTYTDTYRTFSARLLGSCCGIYCR